MHETELPPAEEKFGALSAAPGSYINSSEAGLINNCYSFVCCGMTQRPWWLQASSATAHRTGDVEVCGVQGPRVPELVLHRVSSSRQGLVAGGQ
jgi:hypothetical protein